MFEFAIITDLKFGLVQVFSGEYYILTLFLSHFEEGLIFLVKEKKYLPNDSYAKEV